MSILSKLYPKSRITQIVLATALAAALGAGGVGYLAPAVLPFLHQLMCQGDSACLGEKPIPVPIPQKPKDVPLCVEVNGVKLCR